MASLLRKSRKAMAAQPRFQNQDNSRNRPRMNEIKEDSTDDLFAAIDDEFGEEKSTRLTNTKTRTGNTSSYRGNLASVASRRREPQKSKPRPGESPKSSSGYKRTSGFMGSSQADPLSIEQFKEFEARIQKKMKTLKPPEEQLIEDLADYHEFNKMKFGPLKALKTKLDSKIASQTLKIEKMEMQKMENENKILAKIREGKEKYEVVGLIQRKRNMIDMIQQCQAIRFKALSVQKSLETFILFGELCECLDEFNEICDEFMQQNQIFVNKIDSKVPNLSLIYDFVLKEIQEEGKRMQPDKLKALLSKQLVDREYLQYQFMVENLG